MGSLKLTKVVDGITDELSDIAKATISFDITQRGDSGTEYNKTFTLGDFTYKNGVYELEISNLEIGEYTITETIGTAGKVIDDYKYTTTTYKVGTNAETTGLEATLNVEDSKTSEVGFTNKYVKQVGSLKLTKVVDGITDEDKDTIDFKFIIERSEERRLGKEC